MKKKVKSKKTASKNVDVLCNVSRYNSCRNACGGGVYGLGFLGAVIYYVSTATSFWMGVLGILKSLVWPAFLIYEVLKFLAV